MSVAHPCRGYTLPGGALAAPLVLLAGTRGAQARLLVAAVRAVGLVIADPALRYTLATICTLELTPATYPVQSI
mgnify:CR=1 FL=1